MATKHSSSGRRKARAASTSRSRSAKAAGKSASKSKAAAKPATKSSRGGVKSASRAKAPAKRSSARAKAAPAAARRAFKDRQQPETLRCRNLSVSLTADDLDASMKFYVDGFGFHVRERWEREGKLLGAELVAGSCWLGLSQDDWSKGRDRTKGVGMSIYAETAQDVDTLAARLRERGVAFEGPTTNDWGWRQVSATDPDGFRITIYKEKGSGG